MNVPIEECEEIIGYRQYWLLNDIEHKDIFKFLWDDCDTLQEFKELLYSDPNICNTKAAGWFLHYDSEAAEFFLSQWFGRQKRRFCLDSKQKFIILESAGTKSMIPTAMLSMQSCNEHREEDYYVAIVDDDDFNPLLFRFHSLICSEDFKVNGHPVKGNYAVYYGNGYLAFWRQSDIALEALLESGIYEDEYDIGTSMGR